MLNNASKGKDLAEKQLIVLGEMAQRVPVTYHFNGG
jgi:hypothetical protein